MIFQLLSLKFVKNRILHRKTELKYFFIHFDLLVGYADLYLSKLIVDFYLLMTHQYQFYSLIK